MNLTAAAPQASHRGSAMNGLTRFAAERNGPYAAELLGLSLDDLRAQASRLAAAEESQ